MTEEQISARVVEIEDEIEAIWDEIDAIEIAERCGYMIEEGFWEVEAIGEEEYAIFPVAEEVELEIPV